MLHLTCQDHAAVQLLTLGEFFQVASPFLQTLPFARNVTRHVRLMYLIEPQRRDFEHREPERCRDEHRNPPDTTWDMDREHTAHVHARCQALSHCYETRDKGIRGMTMEVFVGSTQGSMEAMSTIGAGQN